MKAGLRERLDGLANPIVVRQMYQSMHRKGFVGALWLLLVGSLGSFAIAYGGGSGGGMFLALGLLTYLVAGCGLPLLTFSSLQDEIKSRTIELVHITRLDAARHVRGRLLASLLNLGLIYALLGPFVAAAFLAKGVGIDTIALYAYAMFLWAAVLCALAILFASLTVYRGLRALSKLAFIAIVVWGLISIPGGMPMWADFGRPPGSVWRDAVIAGAFGVLGIWFFLACATTLLTFEADKSWGASKFVLLLAVLGTVGMAYVVGTNAWVVSIIVGAACAFWGTEVERVPRRVERRLRRSGVLMKVLRYPFTDGAGPTALYLVLALALAAAGPSIERHRGFAIGKECAEPLLFVLTYSLLLVTIARVATMLLPARLRRPAWTRGIALVLVAAASAWSIPALAEELSPTSLAMLEHGPSKVLLPLYYLHYIVTKEPPLGSTVRLLAVPLAVGLVYHVIVIARHFPRYMRAYRRESSERS